MIYFRARSENIGRKRLSTLLQSADRLRLHALGVDGDIEGWRLARQMRDAVSLPQAMAAERDFGIYQREHKLNLAIVA